MPVFMFNDIESSTRLWEEHQEAMGQAVSRHDAILQELIGQYGGRILRHRGDGISAVFESGEPLVCAIAVQHQFAVEDWGAVGQIRIRLALHAGYAERRVFESGTIGQKEEYFGPVLNRTARVMDAGWGGQILLTPAVVNSYTLPEGAILQDLGVHLLKDLHDPQRIYGLIHPDLPAKEFPPLRSLSSRSHNLVAQSTPFVGREEERVKIEDLLLDPACRLLTLVGPGGIGKTRLALQVAAEAIDSFDHGVYAVKLASVESPELMISAIMEAIKPPVYSAQDPKTQLFSYLRDKNMLLVMDNFEHLLDSSSGLLAEILANAPNLKIMVTSRQRLNLQGEWLFKVDGMADSATAGSNESAIQLFMQSARRVQPDFELTSEIQPSVHQIVKLVDGMPLGIELAAAWVQMLSPQEIVNEIESSLDFLTTSLKDVPERHRSLRAVFDQSWNMLTSDEQEILKRLSELQGGFRHETARRVANVSLPALLDLVDKSLLRRTADGRYEMHEFLRQHAQTNLTQMPPRPTEKLTTEEIKQVYVPPEKTDRAKTGPLVLPPEMLQSSAPPKETAAPPLAVEIPALEAEIQNPYKGLRAFQEDDAEDFYGRDVLIRQLISNLELPDAAGRFMAVVGPSGSGKSSVVKAGLIPALRRGALPGSDHWLVIDMMPSAYPLEELESALLHATPTSIPDLLTLLRRDERGLMRAVKRILPDRQDSEMLLVIDQFEELFTLVEDESARFHFLDSLMVAINDPHSRLRVVVTLRADFYDRPLRYPEFGRMMRERTEIVLPLSPEELEQAIVNPAQRAGLTLGTDLVAAIIADVSEQPGALPLLQYTLTELFERRQGRALTLEAYREVGGVSGALARRADELFMVMNPTQQEATRQLFLRLVTPGEGTEDTRRRVRLDELESLSVAGPAMEAVMQIYSEYRLLTFDRDPVTHGPTVEVAHEALIREWRRLREWLDASREDLRLHRRLMSGSSEWLNAGKDPGFLLSGSRLAQYEEWIATTDLEFGQEEWDYLVASMAEKEAREKAEQERMRREIELEQRSVTLERRSIASERRARQRLLYLVITLAIFLVGAVVLSGFALLQSAQRQDALATSEFNKELAETQVAIANTQAGIARLNSSLLLAASAELALTNRDTDLAILLALQASEREAPPEQAASALFKVADAPGTRRQFAGHTGWVNQAVLSSDGSRALSASSDMSLILWDVNTGAQLRTFTGHTDAVLSAAFSPDGTRILSGSQDGSTILWDVESGEELTRFEGHTAAVTTVAFSPDGTTALSGSRDFSLILWDVESGDELHRLEGHTDAVISAVFSPNGTRILSGSQDGTLRLWDAGSGLELTVLAGHTDAVLSVAFSLDGKLALSGSQDNTLRLWDLTTGTEVRRFEGHTDAVMSVAFSPCDRQVLSGSRDRSIRLWNMETGEETLRLLGHTDVVSSVEFSADACQVLSGSYDTTLRMWDIHRGSELRRFAGHTDTVYSAAFSPDGALAISGSSDNSLILWEIHSGRALHRFEGHTDWVRAVAFSPDAQHVMSGSYDTTVILWDIHTGEIVHQMAGHTDKVRAVAINPDGTQAASGGDDGLIILWDLTTGTEIRRFDTGEASVRAVAFSPDGTQLVSGSTDKLIHVWNLDSGEEVRQLAGHTDTVLSMAFSPDGTQLLSGGGDNNMLLWDMATGEIVRRFSHDAQVFSVAFSPNAAVGISSGTQDGSLILWDLTTGEQMRQFIGHRGIVYSVAFSPDGRSALSASGDTNLLLWRVDYTLADLIAWTRANRYVGELTDAQREQYRIGARVETTTGDQTAVAMLGTATPSITMPPTDTLAPTATFIPATTAAPTIPVTETPTPTPSETPTNTPEPPTETEVPTQTEAVTESAVLEGTLTEIPATETPIPPSETPEPATATPTQDLLATAPILLRYDGDSLVLFNQSQEVQDVSGLTFIQSTADGERLTFDSDLWSGGSQPPSDLPPQDCFHVWRSDLTVASLPLPDYCDSRHAWRAVPAQRWFWISDAPDATFEVRRADEVLATCSISAGECAVLLDPTSPPSAEAVNTSPTPRSVAVEPSPTPAETAVAAPVETAVPESTETAAPGPTETAVPAAAETSASDTPVVLRYDGDSFVLLNRSQGRVDVSKLTFIQVTADGDRITFDSDSWYGGSQPPHSLPQDDCFQVWRADLTVASLPPPDYCQARHAWRALAQNHWFWISSDPAATFEVRRADEVLTTCSISAGECALPLE